MNINSYLDQIGEMELLSVEEELNLAKRIDQGDEYARNTLVERNLKLVVHIAKDYINKGLDYEDLIQEGNLGLMKAVDKYDHTKGARFSTYATYWIKESISRAVDNYGRSVRLPVYKLDQIRSLYRTKYILENSKGSGAVTNEMLADELDITLGEVNQLFFESQNSLSLNQEQGIDEDETITLEETLTSGEHFDPSFILDKVDMKSQIENVLGKLDERELKIVSLKFGIGTSTTMNNRQISEVLEISPARVGQLLQDILNKLRVEGENISLDEFLKGEF